MTIEDVRAIGLILFVGLFICVLFGLSLLTLAAWKLRKIDVPPNATFAETLHYTPFFVVFAVDLLDLALDFLAAPLSWVILDKLGLRALRGVSAVEALIPGTQLIPTMTLCWFGVRLFNIRA